ncbi:hypothetical protein [Marinobacter confluentis]|uniref:Uncharacterized protein n=1 Tax=Marinobacter confluentis TaxID=1697557 RepID=A0A4Z1CJJ9_9GAMM|nr:hypothetical protein [Marinobacter confluentis]TGN41832.1 hypothetical protein E5Q11_04740 [Marinobacter confluentis]
MRTLVIIVGGILLWAVITGVTKLLNNQAGRSWTPTGIFAAVWLVITSWNIWVGVTQAGYTFMQELPIFLVTYLLPIAVAVFIKRKFLSA